jgi:hypothetical protein
MPVCDGCGASVDEAHIRQRIERLELATRCRPIHIHVLLLDAAPPAKLQDYFYRSAGSPGERSVASRMFFDEMAKCIGHARGPVASEQSILAEFQKRGFFLAYAVECPVESKSELVQTIERLAPSLVLRVNSSYNPKFIAPISRALQDVIPLFQLKGWNEKLILQDGEPFDDPFLGDPQSQAEFGSSLGERLAQALARQG